MGTRGFLGFLIDGEVKIAYCHCDSYPNCVGAQVVTETFRLLKGRGIDGLREAARRLQSATGEPTSEQIEKLKQWADLGVSERKLTDWYCLLRRTQGSLLDMLFANYFIDAREFAADSVMCEYGYLVNLDDQVLEFYIGFQEKPHDKGRFANDPRRDRWYPVALAAVFPFDGLNKSKRIVTKMNACKDLQVAEREPA